MSLVLACTDGSAYAPSVYQHAAWAARRLPAAVEVLHVLDHHRERAAGVDLSGAIGIDARDHLTEELAALEAAEGRVQMVRGKAVLEEARRQLAAAGVEEITTAQRHGALVETLEEFEPRCDLVVLGKRGSHADLPTGHLGGNLERVIRAAVRPVLVASREFRPIERFLVAYDGWPSVTRAIDFLLTSSLLKGAACHLLRAGQVDDRAKWFLEESAGKLREAGYEVSAHAVPGEPERVIGEAIEREGIDLLLMGAYGHSPIRSFILGSTTTTIVRTCLAPVLMFR